MTSENSSLATREVVEGQIVAYTPPSPEEYIALATRQANALKGVVDNQVLYSMIQQKKFPKAEAWQTIVALDGACPITRACDPVVDKDGEVNGYMAHVEIMKHGEVIASGTMVCGFDDFPCRGKSGMAQHRAAMSAAQTWAGAKAARMRYAWVMTLAGYEPTPAEEMHGVGEEAPQKPAQRSQGQRPQQPKGQPNPKMEKLKTLDEVRHKFDPEGKEIEAVSVDELHALVSARFEGRTARALEIDEIDQAIQGVKKLCQVHEARNTDAGEVPMDKVNSWAMEQYGKLLAALSDEEMDAVIEALIAQLVGTD